MALHCILCGSKSQNDHRHFQKGKCQVSHGSHCSECMQIEVLDAKISEARKHLSELLQQRVKCVQSTNRTHDRLISRLPTELVSKIFIYANNEGVQRSLLGSICKGWLGLTLSVPQLWTRLTLNVPVQKISYDMEHKRLSAALSRSGALPLSITVRTMGTTVTGTAEILESAFSSLADLLNSQSHRWRYLSVSLPSHLITLLRGNGQSSRSELWKMSIRTPDLRSSMNGRPVFPDMILPRPLHVWNEGCLIWELAIDWSNTRSYDCFMLNLEELEYLLPNCPHLKTLGMSDLDHDSESVVPLVSTGPIEHRSLEELSLSTGGNSIQLDSVLARLAFPSLRKLVLGEFSNPSHNAAWLPSFLQRSSCPLQHLTVTYCAFDVIADILRLTPELKSLSINETFCSDLSSFYALIFSTTSMPRDDEAAIESWFLPKLRSLHLALASIEAYPAWQLIPPIFPDVPPLPERVYRRFYSLVIDLNSEDGSGDFIGPEELRAFDRLRKQGFDLLINEGSDDFIQICAERISMMNS